MRWGGIAKGLKPLLPRIDRVIYAIVCDLAARGLLDSALVLMMGEFGRGPVINTNAGRDHWTNCMSVLAAGGGLPAGQVVGSTDAKGYDIKDRKVGPSDIAATVFRHLGIDSTAHWKDPQGRPVPTDDQARTADFTPPADPPADAHGEPLTPPDGSGPVTLSHDPAAEDATATASPEFGPDGLAAKHTREVIDPFLKRMRPKTAFVMYSLPGGRDPHEGVPVVRQDADLR